MKIAIISPGLFSVPPVVGTSVEHVINQVANKLKQHNEVTVFTRTCPQYPVSTKDGNLFYKRIRFYNSKYYLNTVIKALIKSPPDVIVVENRPSYVLTIKENCPAIPVLLNMHSDVYSLPAHIKPSRMVEVSEKVDAMITNSKALGEIFMRKYPALQGKTYPAHLGIELAPYEKALKDEKKVAQFRKKFDLQSGDLTILFAGRLLRKKGIHLILEVMPQLLRQYTRLKLLITGSPRYGKSVQTKYMNSIMNMSEKLDDHVIFTDFISPENMPYIYQLADIVVTPSIWNEPFLLVNLEAMASKKPVITTNKGGIPEVVKHDETGFVFSADQYREELPHFISLLLDSKVLREKFAANGWERACHFSWERTAERYLQVFKTVADR